MPQPRHIICSGEELPLALQDRCLESLPQAALHNLYGPTEAAIDVTHWDCRLDASKAGCRSVFRLRRPSCTSSMARGSRCRSARLARFLFGGIGVARGYRNRPGPTAERFIADPFSQDPQNRLYKTPAMSAAGVPMVPSRIR